MRLPLHSLLSLMKAAPNPKTCPPDKTRELCYLLKLPDSRTAHDVNSASHLHEFRRIVALYKSRLVGAPFENVLKPRPQTGPRDIVLIDPDLPVGADLNDVSVRWLNRVRRIR